LLFLLRGGVSEYIAKFNGRHGRTRAARTLTRAVLMLV